jgi:hypothetical protein
MENISVFPADASFTVNDAALRLQAGSDGVLVSLALDAPSGAWDLSAYDSVFVGLRNPGVECLTVQGRVENAGATSGQDACRGVIVLKPGEEDRLRVRLARRPVDPGFDPFAPFLRYARNINVRDGTVDPSAISRVVVAIQSPVPDQVVEVGCITAEGDGTPDSPPFFPFVDEFGQYVHADWPGKVYAEADFASRAQEELAEMTDWPGPPEWDQYGGWAAGPSLEATGFFHPTKHDAKWWLVDPEGKLFWSYGPTGVGFGGSTPITDREHWFRGLPAPDSPLGQYYRSGTGARDRYYRDKTYQTFDFANANLHRKYGTDFAGAVVDLSHRRLRNWGFNTIGNWSDERIYLRRKTPYVVAVHFGGAWLNGIPDAFDPQFRQTVRERMERERGRSAGDPWCIGYFVQNELWWGHWDDGRMVTHNIVQGPPTASKRVFVDDLKEKHVTVEALNTSWATSYHSWEAVLEHREAPDPKNPSVEQDYGAFGLKFCEAYFSIVRQEVKRVAPNNLYLGCRFHGHIDNDLIEVAARYCDIISYNVYDREPGARFNRFIGIFDKPFIVGEFGVGSDPTQTPFRGDDLSPDPDGRARAHAFYLERAFTHPLLVGAHFFQYRDQALTGRADGEAVLRGFINVADTPHFDLVQANRKAAYSLYQKRLRSE